MMLRNNPREGEEPYSISLQSYDQIILPMKTTIYQTHKTHKSKRNYTIKKMRELEK
jgi:hypothetical protein